ncbi:MAG: DnaB-like helicase C-terminal domain-containing protein [Brevinematales bacterium]
MDNDKTEILNRLYNKTNMETIFETDLKETKDGYIGRCPFPDHEDKNPSFSIGHKDGNILYHCFGCERTGDIIKYIANKTGRKTDGKDFIEILRELSNMAGLTFQNNKPVKQPDKKPDFERFHNQLLNNQDALTYLQKRGMKDLSLFGYDNGYYKILYQTPETDYIKSYKPAEGNNKKDYLNEKGMNKIYPFNMLNIKDRDKIYLMEGEFDALYLFQNHNIPAAAVMGHNILDGTIELLKPFQEIDIVFDNDDQGKDGREKAKKKLTDNGYKGSIKYIDYEAIDFKYKDINEAFQNNDNEAVNAFLSDKALKTVIEAKKDIYESYKQFVKEKQKRDKNRTAQFIGYELDTFKDLCKYCDGIQKGLYIIGAAPNIGKTALLVNLFWDLLQTGLNHFTETGKHISGLFVSLDDSKDIITNRFISHQSGLTINAIQRKQPEQDTIQSDNTYKDLYELIDLKLLTVIDDDDIHNILELEKTMEMINKTNSEMKPERGTVLFIDGLHNLDIENCENTRDINIKRAMKIKALSNKYQIPIFATVEVLKNSQDKKTELTMSDIMESGKYAYNASIVWLLSENKEAATDDQETIKLVLKYGKNKLSSFKGTQHLLFEKSISKISEIPNHGDALEINDSPKEEKQDKQIKEKDDPFSFDVWRKREL